MAEQTMFKELQVLLEGTGQEHVLAHWAELSTEGKIAFHAQCKEVLRSKEYIEFLGGVLTVSKKLLETGLQGVSVEPPNAREHIFSLTADLQSEESQLGLDVIKSGSGAVVILAGGSGTRLGATFPKGMLACPSLALGYSLFEWHCRRVLKAEQLAGAPPGSVQLSFMTSGQTHEATTAFLKEHAYFGLQGGQVSFFIQSSLPCFTEEGKFLLQDKGTIATAPGGNGGIWSGLDEGGILDRFEAKGVRFAQILTVDNLLAKAADPAFFGFAASKQAEVVVKSTPKISDHEAVGVFAQREGKWGVVEYTEVGKERAESKHSETGARLFDCANIAIHLVSLKFMRTAAVTMKTFQSYHAARKQIPTEVMATPGGDAGKAKGLKAEAFIFDLFQFASPGTFYIVQVARTEEFAPVKNADNVDTKIIGKDTPASAVGLLHSLHKGWVGNDLSNDLGKDLDCRVEICPSVSYQGEALGHLLQKTLPEIQKMAGKECVVVIRSKENIAVVPFEAKV